jgi:hypothetical protein
LSFLVGAQNFDITRPHWQTVARCARLLRIREGGDTEGPFRNRQQVTEEVNRGNTIEDEP